MQKQTLFPFLIATEQSVTTVKILELTSISKVRQDAPKKAVTKPGHHSRFGSLSRRENKTNRAIFSRRAVSFDPANPFADQ